MAETERNVLGAQSLQRAIAILRIVAEFGDRGCRTGDVAERIQLHLATVDRMLRVLAQERLLERFGPERLYRIGPEIVALSAVRLSRFSLVQHLSAGLDEIAMRTEDTVYLSLRAGDESVCLARREGRYPIRALTVDVGARRPLGVGGGPLALLAFLPDAEVAKLLERNRNAFSPFGLTAESVRDLVARARELDFALNDGRIIPEMTAVGVPVRDVSGKVVAAVSVAAINARLDEGRRVEVAGIIRDVLAPLTPLPSDP